MVGWEHEFETWLWRSGKAVQRRQGFGVGMSWEKRLASLPHLYYCSPRHTAIRKKSILEDVPAPPPRTSFGESESHPQGCSVTGQSLLLLWGALLLLADWVGLLSFPATPAKPTRHFISSHGWELPQAPLQAHCSSRTLDNLPCPALLLITLMCR